MTDSPHDPATPFVVSRSRLEFLADGIFAIAMTILVLELRVPEIADRHSPGELASALMHHRAAFASYVLSFLMLGIFWFNHNQHFRHFTHITRPMLALTLVQLAAAAFLPFSAALVGRFTINLAAQLVYIGCILVFLLATMLTWVAARRSGALSAQLDETERRTILRRNLGGCSGVGLMFLIWVVRVLAH